MISLHKCNKRCDAVDLSTKICVSSKTKNVVVKVFNMITRINEARTLIRRISCNANDWRKCISNSVTCSQNKNCNNDKCQCGCKKYRACERKL